jgi:ABC-type amino acid transport system permease subunit
MRVSGRTIIKNSVIRNNASTQAGGGIYSSCCSTYDTALFISNTTISNNNAPRGGGIFNSSPLHLNNVTITENAGSWMGGGIYSSDGGSANTGSIDIQNSIIAKTIRFAVRTLAVIPSIIYGLFGLGFFIKFVGTSMDNAFLGGQLKWGQPNILWASLTMALLTLPVVIVSVEEALKTVPRDLRAASLALGATKWQTIWKVVIPGSISGIMTGTILAVSRGA